ncbi:MAG TPA: PaaI family thioesterase [Streptosporangiaceae bacterium]|nr:PaaI family thioesterase [Streptosporangiaceae bacterium]
MNESATMTRSGPFWEFLAGRLPAPPAAATLGWQLSWVAPERGEIEVAFDARDCFTNPMGNVQGGFLAAMLDDTLGPALAATLDDGEFAPTVELKVSFLRPALPGPIIGTGRVVHRGGTIAFLAGELKDPAGELLATATATARIVRPDRK